MQTKNINMFLTSYRLFSKVKVELMLPRVGQVVTASASETVDLALIPVRVISKTLKMVMESFLVDIHKQRLV